MSQPKIVLKEGKFYFDAGDGSTPVECPVWLEKSKANEAHPDGKPWILLPKDNVANRRYYSVDLFHSTAVDGVVVVEIKTAAPRVLGATGVKQEVIKFLSEEEAAEYTKLVNDAVAIYKSRKAQGSLKLDEMDADQLTAYIEALKKGEKYSPAENAPKSFIEVFTTAQYERYTELLAIAQENKANAPKAVRAKLTDEQKAVRAEKRRANELSKAEELLKKLQAIQNGDMAAESVDEEDEPEEDAE